MRNPSLVGLFAMFISLGVSCVLSPAEAQVARVTTVVRIVQRSAEGSAKWLQTQVGTSLNTGDKVRTGQRSKAEIRFEDKSVVRLAEISDLTIRAGKDLQLRKGKMYGDFKSPGRIRSGSVVANVKGSTFTITALPDGSVMVVLYQGGLTLNTPFGTQVMNVATGDHPVQIHLTPQQAAAMGGEGQAGPFKVEPVPDDQLIDISTQMPPAGTTLYVTPNSNTQLNIKFDQISTNSTAQTQDQDQNQAILKPGQIFISPPLPPPFSGGEDTGSISVGVHSLPLRPALARSALARITQSYGAPGTRLALQKLLEARLGVLSRQHGRISTRDALPGSGKGGSSSSTAASESPEREVAPYYFAPHFNGDLSTFLFNGGSAAAARLHVNGMNSGISWEVAATPTSLSPSGNEVDLTDAFITKKTEKYGTFTLGRQRFLKGPVQNTVVGTLMRQFGRDIQDAFTWTPPLKVPRITWDLSYLIDAYPTGLPTAVPDLQKGYYSRLSYDSKKVGNYGLNITGNDFAPTRGMTLDFGVPVIPNQVDLYGEWGEDTFDGRIRTFGLYFGGLYRAYGLDVFLERAWLDRTVNGVFFPSETLLRIYRKFGEQYSVVLLVNQKAGSGYDLGIGLVTKLPHF